MREPSLTGWEQVGGDTTQPRDEIERRYGHTALAAQSCRLGQAGRRDLAIEHAKQVPVAAALAQQPRGKRDTAQPAEDTRRRTSPFLDRDRRAREMGMTDPV